MQRLRFRQIEETHLMENVIYNELRVRGFQVDVGYKGSVENEKMHQVGAKIISWRIKCVE